MTLKWLAIAAVMALAAVAAPAAMANGGGGGGGSMGSLNNAPRGGTDPAQAYQEGVAALRAQDYGEAVRQLRVARRAAPNDGAINYTLGLAYLGNGDTDDAATAFERSARADNGPVDARVQLGRVYLQLNRRDDAVAQQTALADAIAACDAACGDARRADLQRAHDQLAQALTQTQTPTAADPASSGWNFPSVEEGRAAYTQAVGFINQERFPDAWEALQRAHTAVGPHPDVLNYMGFVSRKLGRFDQAFAYYGQALALDPNHLGANEYLGELYIQLGQMDRARAQLARLDELCAYSCAERDELAHWIEQAR